MHFSVSYIYSLSGGAFNHSAISPKRVYYTGFISADYLRNTLKLMSNKERLIWVLNNLIMHIRYYTNEDKKQVILLWQKVFFDAPPWAEPSILLKKKLEVDNLVFVAEDNGKVIGSSMAGYDGHSGWVYSVAVEP